MAVMGHGKKYCSRPLLNGSPLLASCLAALKEASVMKFETLTKYGFKELLWLNFFRLHNSLAIIPPREQVSLASGHTPWSPPTHEGQ
jgi:hypothetical protein